MLLSGLFENSEASKYYYDEQKQLINDDTKELRKRLHLIGFMNYIIGQNGKPISQDQIKYINSLSNEALIDVYDKNMHMQLNDLFIKSRSQEYENYIKRDTKLKYFLEHATLKELEKYSKHDAYARYEVDQLIKNL